MKVAYLIGCYPAINHGYLLTEIRNLRQLGFEIEVASISAPDRRPERLTAEERTEAARSRYIKPTPRGRIVFDNAVVALRTPVRYFGALLYALRMGRGWRGTLQQVFYFIEAVLVGRWMEEKRVSHLYAHFSSHVALIASRLFPISMSFGVYGFGELHDPTGTRLADKIRAARMVRAISLHSRSLLMLDSNPRDWGKIRYIPLGIDVKRYVPRERAAATERLILVSVGRLSPEKGQRLLLEAVANLVERGRNVCLYLVGDGPDRKVLEDQAHERRINSHVVFEGWVDQPKLEAIYASAHVFVMASLYEGIPIVLMEAMAMEIPCVAPWITGIPELISNREEGLLFAPANVRQLADCIAELQDSEDLRRNIGAAARRRVLRDYDIDTNTKCLATVLRLGLSAKLP